MGVFFAILVIYFLFQLNRRGNNGMFTKLKAIWFEAQYGEGSVVKATQDCIRPHSGILLRVTFKSRFLRRNKEDSALVRVPREFLMASETVQDAVLAETLGRSGISVSAITTIEEIEESLPDPVAASKCGFLAPLPQCLKRSRMPYWQRFWGAMVCR